MGIEWGSLIKPVFDLIRPKGRVELNKKMLVIHHYAEGNSTAIDCFTIYLQFLNRRRDQVIISDFEADYFDGKTLHKMYHAGSTISPAYPIAAKTPLDLKLMVNVAEELMDVPFKSIEDKTARIDLSYKVNKKTVRTTISHIETDGPDNPYTWVAF
jgi:hypothetical protein